MSKNDCAMEGGDGDSRFFKAVAAAVERKHMAAEQTSWPELVGVQCEVWLPSI